MNLKKILRISNYDRIHPLAGLDFIDDFSDVKPKELANKYMPIGNVGHNTFGEIFGYSGRDSKKAREIASAMHVYSSKIKKSMHYLAKGQPVFCVEYLDVIRVEKAIKESKDVQVFIGHQNPNLDRKELRKLLRAGDFKRITKCVTKVLEKINQQA